MSEERMVAVTRQHTQQGDGGGEVDYLEEVVMDDFPGPVKKVGGVHVFTISQIEWLRRWFPVVENERVMEATGLKFSTMYRLVKAMGLKKSEEGLRGIKRRQAAHVKALCEANGYYDTRRGKPLPEAALKASAARRAAPDWVHPIKRLKESDPEKYAEMCRARGERRKETIRRERARALYGLPLKTKLHRIVCQKKYTRRQTSHRYTASRRGYIMARECWEGSGYRWLIWWDEDTDRSDLFEKNLREDGFIVKQYNQELEG